MRQFSAPAPRLLLAATLISLPMVGHAQLKLPSLPWTNVVPTAQLSAPPGQLGFRLDLPVYQTWGLTGHYSRMGAADPTTNRPTLAGSRETRGFGLAKSETLFTGDRFSLTVSQPGNLTSGPLGFYAPANTNELGAGVGTNLRGGARELVTELQYFAPITRQSGLGFSLINRARPNNDDRAPDERIMMMRFSTQF